MPILFILFGIFFYIYCEISLLVSVGSAIGVLPTILLLFAISFVGIWLVKLRGIYTIYSIRQQLMQGQVPTDAVIGSVMFVLAGVLLIIPGFVSDILAILCVLPVTRQLIQAYLLRMFKSKVRFSGFSFGAGNFRREDENTFEAEFERQQDQDKWIK